MIFKDLNIQLWQEIIILVMFILIVLVLIYIIIMILFGFRKKNDTYKEVVTKEIIVKKQHLEEVKNKEPQGPKLSEKEIKVRKKIEENNITKKELQLLVEQEQIIIPEDFIINSITTNELSVNKFKKIESGNKDFGLKGVKMYLQSKENIDCTPGIGRRADAYKINGRTVCMLKELDDNKFSISLKLGPAYAAQVKDIFKKQVSDSVFPQGLIWFNYSNTIDGNITLEAVKQAIDISYAIASLGY